MSSVSGRGLGCIWHWPEPSFLYCSRGASGGLANVPGYILTMLYRPLSVSDCAQAGQRCQSRSTQHGGRPLDHSEVPVAGAPLFECGVVRPLFIQTGF